MHRRHELDLLHHGNGAGGAGAGHNHRAPPRTAQWQTPHRPNGYDHYYHNDEPDLDLVETAFAEGFVEASDPTSFLRLARIPFEATDGEGRRLVLLRVECGTVVDVGSVSPHLGGGSMRYSPLPRRMTTRRQRLHFIYFDGSGPRPLSLAKTRTLTEA
jgi:hypothetical protein